jgi:hypothetical protein
MSVEILGRPALARRMLAERRRAARAVSKGVSSQVRATQIEVRRAVNLVFSGSRSVKGGDARVANAVRTKHYDDENRGSAGLIYSRFGRKRAGGFADFIAARLFGALVRPLSKKWLLIPLQTGGISRNAARAAVRRHEDVATRGGRKDLAFVPLKGGRTILIVKRSKTRDIPVAILVKQVRYPRRASPEDFVRHALNGLPGEIARAYEK